MSQPHPDPERPVAPSFDAPPPFPQTPTPPAPAYGQPQVDPYAPTPYGQPDAAAYPGVAYPQPYGQSAPYLPAYGAPYGVDPLTGLPYSDKSKLVAGLLQIFLGGLGIGRFYLGNIGIAIAQIAVTFITLGIGALWPLIDGIVLLAGNPRDAQGRPLRP